MQFLDQKVLESLPKMIQEGLAFEQKGLAFNFRTLVITYA